MIAVASLLIVIALSLLVVRAGAVALQLTGLSKDVARFQALSAFSGAGFTTREAESIVDHPARRRIASILIRLGSVGIATGISSLLLSFIGAGEAAADRFLVLLLGVLGLSALAASPAFDRILSPLLARLLARWTELELRDYADLLSLGDEYRIAEIDVEEGAWLAERRLDELDLPSEGVLILGLTRSGGEYKGAPQPHTQIRSGDAVVMYGRTDRLDELAQRSRHDEAAHRDAKADHAKRVAEQDD